MKYHRFALNGAEHTCVLSGQKTRALVDPARQPPASVRAVTRAADPGLSFSLPPIHGPAFGTSTLQRVNRFTKSSGVVFLCERAGDYSRQL